MEASAILSIQNYSYAYPDTHRPVFKNIDMTIRAGECHCLTGPTGAGKSTLMMAIKELLPPGKTTGKISSGALETDGFGQGGVVLQNPDVQLFRPTIGNETAFGLENIGMPPKSMMIAVTEALAALGFDKPLSTKVSTLSMGQKYRLLLAGMLAMGHQLLLMDEPGAQLDPIGIMHLKKWLHHLKSQNVGILLSEHYPEEFKDLVDVYWFLHPSGSVKKLSAMPSVPPVCEPLPKPPQRMSGPVDMRVSNLSPPKEVTAPIWSDLSFSVHRGERVAVFGGNGAGKSTLVGCLIGFLKPSRGQVAIWGQSPSPARLRGRIGYLSQAPHTQLFETTVHEELAFSLKRFGTLTAEIDKHIDEILERFGIQHLADRSPHKLSFGQQHIVALAAVTVFTPELLVLDDPFAGLDRWWQARISGLLTKLNHDEGTTILWTSHRPREITNWATRTLSLNNNEINVDKS